MKTFFKALTISFLIGALSIGVAKSQISSYKVSSGDINVDGDGFYYALPLNSVKVDVTVSKSEFFKGKFSDYALKLLGISNIIKDDKTTYGIKNIVLSTETSIDTLNLYFAQLPAKWNDDYLLELVLSDKGLLSELRAQRKNAEAKEAKQGAEGGFRDLMKPVIIEKVDTIIRRVSIDTTTIEEKILKRSISEKSIEQQAREIADLIYRIEDNKFSLITGYQEVNYSKESLQFMLEKLNLMEEEYLAYFKGTSKVSEQVYTFYYTPQPQETEVFRTLFRFSETDGISSRDSRSGVPVSISGSPTHHLSQIKALETKRMSSKKKAKGLIYRIPEEVNYSITMGNNVLSSKKLFINQLGIITFLPSANLNHADFHENGTLKTLIMR